MAIESTIFNKQQPLTHTHTHTNSIFIRKHFPGAFLLSCRKPFLYMSWIPTKSKAAFSVPIGFTPPPPSLYSTAYSILIKAITKANKIQTLQQGEEKKKKEKLKSQGAKFNWKSWPDYRYETMSSMWREKKQVGGPCWPVRSVSCTLLASFLFILNIFYFLFFLFFGKFNFFFFLNFTPLLLLLLGFFCGGLRSNFQEPTVRNAPQKHRFL